MTMMRPLRLMILHFSQMGLTEGLTFMLKLPPLVPLFLSLLGAPSDAPLGQVIRRHLQSDLISWQDTDEVHPQLT